MKDLCAKYKLPEGVLNAQKQRYLTSQKKGTPADTSEVIVSSSLKTKEKSISVTKPIPIRDKKSSPANPIFQSLPSTFEKVPSPEDKQEIPHEAPAKLTRTNSERNVNKMPNSLHLMYPCTLFFCLLVQLKDGITLWVKSSERDPDLMHRSSFSKYVYFIKINT